MALEVILKKPVYGLGAEADLVKVKPGYARNFLIPRGLAVTASDASKKVVEGLKRQRAEREARELNEAQEIATALNKLTLTFPMEANESGKVFGAVTSQDISERLATLGHTIDKKKIATKPLKEEGEHEVQVSFGHGVQARLKVVVQVNRPAAVEEEAPAKKKRPLKAKAEKSE
ncbi:MAG: 50S ribosomal protein L9 [Candidatus Methylacidiphilales bacterium]|nr:50S ribosomal protein L9 [Candidatus Methylacidiphilales bacterium]